MACEFRSNHIYKGIAVPVVADGATVLFWHDQWHGRVLKHELPELFSFSVKKNMSLHQAAQVDLYTLFSLPLSIEAYEQFQQLKGIMATVQISDSPDNWTHIWGNAVYSSSRAYKQFIGHVQLHPSYSWLWNASCQMKHKVFFWLLLKDRVNTRGMLRRRNMELDSYACELCVWQIGV